MRLPHRKGEFWSKVHTYSVLKMTWWVHGRISKKKSCGIYRDSNELLSLGISTYDNWNFKPQISSVFHFDQTSDGQMAQAFFFHANPSFVKPMIWTNIERCFGLSNPF